MLTDEERRELHGALEPAIGPRGADLFMRALPPIPWTDLAAKSDLDRLGLDLRGEMSDLRTEMGDLRTEMTEFRSEIRSEMTSSRTELKGDIADLKSHLWLSCFTASSLAGGLVLAAVALA